MSIEPDNILVPEGEKWDASVMRLNTKRFVVMRNIRNNVRRQLPQLAPHGDNPQRVAIVGGGWSLNDTIEELRQLYFDGVKIVALNGSAKWLMERNLRPSMHIVLDARPDNVEFVQEEIPHCKYFFASQVDPGLIDVCEGRDLTLFHAVAEAGDLERKRLDDFYAGRWTRIPTAGTVGVTSIMVLRMLGYRHQHLFGIDSCLDPRTRAHHAYDQPLNDNDGSAIFKTFGKQFECSSAHASQLESFKAMMGLNGQHLSLVVHGDGMIAHFVKYGAEVSDPESKEA